MLDWQTILVFLIILTAGVYVGRRFFLRLRGFWTKGSCETGCGKCETTTKPQNFVSLKRG